MENSDLSLISSKTIFFNFRKNLESLEFLKIKFTGSDFVKNRKKNFSTVKFGKKKDLSLIINFSKIWSAEIFENVIFMIFNEK